MEQVGDGTNCCGKPLPLTLHFQKRLFVPAESSLSDCDRTTAIFIANRSEQLNPRCRAVPERCAFVRHPASVEKRDARSTCSLRRG